MLAWGKKSEAFAQKNLSNQNLAYIIKWQKINGIKKILNEFRYKFKAALLIEGQIGGISQSLQIKIWLNEEKGIWAV